MDFRSFGLFYNFERLLIFKFNGLVLRISREGLCNSRSTFARCVRSSERRAFSASAISSCSGLKDADFNLRTSWHPASHQRSNQTQEFLLLWPTASPNKKRSDLDIGDLAS
jgi:hypothetical protein